MLTVSLLLLVVLKQVLRQEGLRRGLQEELRLLAPGREAEQGHLGGGHLAREPGAANVAQLGELFAQVLVSLGLDLASE